MRLSGKIALVTGAGRGIGRGCAEALARQGADVVLNDLPDSPDLPTTVERIQALGVRCLAIPADVFARSECERLVDASLAAFGRLDILVSNAAAVGRADFLEFAPDEFERIIRGTLIGGFHISQLAARHMSRRRSGKIIFISSILARLPQARNSAYNAAKAGLSHLAETIAVELAPYRIHVNVIEPGWIDTPAERQWFGEQSMRRAEQQLPLGRVGTPEDIGRAAAFLASDDADYITGAVLRVDGGFWFKDCRAEPVAPWPPE